MTVPATQFYAYYDSPIGRLTLISNGVALTGLYLANSSIRPQAFAQHRQAPFSKVTAALDGYFAGSLHTFNVPLAPEGTPFQQSVWQALTRIPYAATASYGDIAKEVGRPHAARAVGSANHVNPIAIIIPCHRVIGANGKLVGYGGGLPTKEFLLGLEQRAFRPHNSQATCVSDVLNPEALRPEVHGPSLRIEYLAL